jgi:hypothetical protein
MEAREVPAVHIFVTDHVLHVVGDAHANTITVRDNGQGTITVNAGTNHLTASGIHHVDITSGGGADKIDYQLTGALKTTEDIAVHLGKGADQATFNFSDGVAAGGHLKLTVDGGKGADQETVKIGSIAKGGSAVLHLNGGKGHDTLTLTASGTIAGRLIVDMNGGPGHDTERTGVHDTITGTGHLVVNTK